MNPIIRNILALIAGVAIGSLLNGMLITFGHNLISLPAGVSNTEAGLKAGIHLFEPKHFLFPFLAHALGTFVGAFITALTAANRKMLFAMIIGVLFLIGGAMMVQMLPAPMWFNITDLVLAYIPMAWIGGKTGSRKRKT